MTVPGGLTRPPGTDLPGQIWRFDENAKIVDEVRVLFGPSVVDGNAGWFGASGKCWVSNVYPAPWR
jgi:hypothetical protein